MKITMIHVNNHKKAFDIACGKRRFSFPFSKLTSQPNREDPIINAYPDPEVGMDGFTYHLKSGREDTILMDQVLEYNNDPDYVRNQTLFRLTLEAQKLLKKKGISKREIIRRLRTSPTQFYRLLDQTNTQKTIDQMIRLIAALDYFPVVTIEPKKQTG